MIGRVDVPDSFGKLLGQVNPFNGLAVLCYTKVVRAEDKGAKKKGGEKTNETKLSNGVQEKIVRLREKAGRTYPSLTEEYGESKPSVKNWC